MKKSIWIVRVFSVVVVGIILGLSIPSSFVYAQPKRGEIININYKYKIAFSDITENDVRSGDKVGVKLSDGSQIFLEVVETYPVMTKLSVSQDPAYELTDQDFAKITVGNAILIQDVNSAKLAGKIALKPSVLVEEKAVEEASADQPIEVYQPVQGNERPVTGSGKTRAVSEPQQAQVESTAAPVNYAKEDILAKIVSLQERVEKLVENNIKFSENISQLLNEKTALEAALKEKDAAFKEVQLKMDEALSANQPLEEKVTAFESELAGLKKEKVDDEKTILDLNQKLVELKKKLARMVEIVNNQMKAYE